VLARKFNNVYKISALSNPYPRVKMVVVVMMMIIIIIIIICPQRTRLTDILHVTIQRSVILKIHVAQKVGR